MTEPQRILLGYDGSACARRALELGATLAPDRSEFTVATVAEPSAFGAPDPHEVQEQKRLLAEGVELLAARGIRAQTMAPVDEDAAAALLSAAERLGADLLVLGTHRRGTIGRIVLGSVASAVVHQPPCSVLVVP